MDLDYLAMFDSPIQIGVVLLIALLVFGPQKLPEIGKQIGSALRELKKATNDVVKQFSTDHEPDNRYDPYPSYNDNSHYDSYAYNSPALPSPPDLTDYTIAGMEPVAANGAPGMNLTDYTLAPSTRSVHQEPNSTAADAPAPSLVAAADAHKGEESHV